MIHPDTYIQRTPKGLGVFTNRNFHRGEILWITDEFDVKISLDRYRQLDPLMQSRFNTYSYMDDKERAIMPWDGGKYVNHSCEPNSTGLLQYDNISIAVRDINADEEIVEDYFSYYGHFENFMCKCGSPKCRGFIGQDNTYDSGLRLDLNEMANTIMELPQPLLDVKELEEKNLKEFFKSFVKRRKAM